MPASPALRLLPALAAPALLLAGAGALPAAPDPVPAQSAREIAARYARYDGAYGIRNEAAFRTALGALIGPDFTQRAPNADALSRPDWLRERVAAAALGAPPWPGNTGGFSRIERLEVRARTTPERFCSEGDGVTVDVTETISTQATGRRAPNAARESTSAVFTTEARDHWRRAKQGWLWHRRDIVVRYATSSIAAEAPEKK